MKRLVLALLCTTIGISSVSGQAPSPQQQTAKPQLGPNQWTVDGSHSAANFSVRHMMVTTVRGQLGPIPAGTVEYDGKDLRTAIEPTSKVLHVAGINTQNVKRDAHLRSDDFFDAANHPFIAFKSKRVEVGAAGSFKLIGDLTIRGNTKEVALNVEGPTPAVKGPGGVRMGATATTKDQSAGVRAEVELND